MKRMLLILTPFLALGTSAISMAADVTIEKAHLCCGQCTKGVEGALKDIDGISSVMCSKDDKTIKFSATNDEAAQKGLAALMDAGFYGSSKVKEPESKVDKDAKQDEVKISKLHLCCGQCVKAIDAALKDVKGVEKVETEQKEGKVTLTGNDIKLGDVLKKLHDTGFHGKIE